jgi:hypothetical protein
MWCFPLVFGIAGVQLTDTVIYFGLAFSFLGSVTVRMPFSIGSRNLVGLDLVLNADQAVEGDGALALAGLLLSGSLDGEGALDDRVAVHAGQRRSEQPVDLILNVPSRESAAETGGRGNAECVGISVAY